jgi:basic amino acid/polyamine antiporter, APA family
VNIGTLLAFTIVCSGVWILRRRHPEMERPFKTPLVPLVPILGILSALYLMIKLPLITWEVLVLWLITGLVIYFTYSVRHSRVQHLTPAERARGPRDQAENKSPTALK